MAIETDNRSKADRALLRSFKARGSGYWEELVMHEDKMESALKMGANPDAALPDGKTALMLALDCIDGEHAVQEMLRAHTGCSSAVDGFGRTALHWAAARGKLAALRALAVRVDTSLADSDGMTPFMLALEKGAWACAMELRSRSELLAVDKHGRSALWFAQQSYKSKSPNGEWISQVDTMLLDGFALVEAREIVSEHAERDGQGAAAPAETSKRSRL